MTTANNASCYSTGDILGAVLGTFFSTVFFVAALGGAIVYVVCRPYLRQQQEFRLRKLNENSANGGFQKPEIHSFDELTSANRTRRTRTRRTGSSISIRNNLWNKSYSDDLSQIKDYRQMRRNSWVALFNRKRFSLDARFSKTSSFTLRRTRPSSAPRHSKTSIQSSLYGEQLFDVFEVPLRSHDPVGLGFNVFGNLMEGVYVTELLNRGPARDSGLISPGDRIVSLTVNTEHMVLEDALTILSYSSSYPIRLRLMRETKSRHGRHLATETTDDNNGDNNNNNDNDNSGDNPLSGATAAAADGLELLHQLHFRSQSMEELSMYHPKDTGLYQGDTSIASQGSWSTGLEARRRRRPVLVDDYLWSGTRVWRSEDDWFWGGDPATLTTNPSNPRLLGEQRPSINFSSCDSSQGSVSSIQKQRKSANYLDLSRIPESSNYLVRFPASRSLTRMVGVNLGLGCLKSRSLQTMAAAETQGRGGQQEARRRGSERNSGLVEGKSVSEGDSLHETGRPGIWSPFPGLGTEIEDRRSSTARPFVISYADVQGAVNSDAAVDVKAPEKTEVEKNDDSETILKDPKSPQKLELSYLLTEQRTSLNAENHQRKDNVEYF